MEIKKKIKVIFIVIVLLFVSNCKTYCQRNISYRKASGKDKFILFQKSIDILSLNNRFVVIDFHDKNSDSKKVICLEDALLLAAVQYENKLSFSSVDQKKALTIVKNNQKRYFVLKEPKAVSNILIADTYTKDDLELFEKSLNIDSLIDEIVINIQTFKRLFKSPHLPKPDNFQDLVIGFEKVSFRLEPKEKRMLAHLLFDYGIASFNQHNTGLLVISQELPEIILNQFYKRYGEDWEPDFSGG